MGNGEDGGIQRRSTVFHCESSAPPAALIALHRDQYRQRTGRELTDDNVWIRERLSELNSLDAILERIAADETAPNEAIAGAGTAKRLPLQVIATRGAHDSALRKADPRTDT
jgi:hypothetical protein